MASETKASEAGAGYTLHYFTFSLYSLMVRFALQLGRKLNTETAPHVRLEFVNLQAQENLGEEYLTTVNSKGQVPCLTSALLPSGLSDSRDIAKWLCEKQPELVPAAHKEAIDELMDKLYSFHFKALNIPPEAAANGIPNVAAAMLESSSISEKHRRALEIKSIFHDTLHSRTIELEHIAQVERHVSELMAELAGIIEEHGADGSRWIFGQQPTILDAYASALMIRLLDNERLELLPPTVQAYAKAVQASEEWRQVTHGRPTVYQASMGAVADLDPK
ncbi:Thioredoxin-like protein [Cordyceps fumosorosea ARSEF 2679]|uniref:Thioredoxin-like protein n=1 Tax=Cordyceps fumosorosea (strain ARSEF 2679) TaxID=1081104 RepID=A0A168EP23_CORFA|nr:Thioredoxin-like protein [Cordyceps fumosorosea ARSEF 2679]OAA74051.1 Thioredoxin-like protein [Cordyceps fumosorosea ARSEF 2679]